MRFQEGPVWKMFVNKGFVYTPLFLTFLLPHGTLGLMKVVLNPLKSHHLGSILLCVTLALVMNLWVMLTGGHRGRSNSDLL